MTTVTREKQAAAEAVGWVRDALDISYVDIGLAVDVDERTVRRWKAARTIPRGAHRDKIEELGELKDLLLAVFGTAGAAAVWMKTPMPSLRSRTPAAAFREGKVAVLIDMLATVESGAFI